MQEPLLWFSASMGCNPKSPGYGDSNAWCRNFFFSFTVKINFLNNPLFSSLTLSLLVTTCYNLSYLYKNWIILRSRKNTPSFYSFISLCKLKINNDCNTFTFKTILLQQSLHIYHWSIKSLNSIASVVNPYKLSFKRRKKNNTLVISVLPARHRMKPFKSSSSWDRQTWLCISTVPLTSYVTNYNFLHWTCFHNFKMGNMCFY